VKTARSPLRTAAAAAVAAAAVVAGVGGSLLTAPAASAAVNDCPAVRIFNLEGTFAFDGLHGAPVPPDFIADAPFAPSRALIGISEATHGAIDHYTINYPAAGGFPIFASERAGVDETQRQAASFLGRCGGSHIALLGYSQGAWAAGDVATDIANNTVPGVSPDKLVASFLVGDPVNQATQRPGFGTQIGARTGAGPLPARFAGFGANNATTFEFCNPGDNVCDAPPGPGPAMWQYLGTLSQPSPAHTQYDTVQVASGTSTVQWIRNYGTADGRVIGAIRDRWLSLGGPTGFLGAPLTDELTTPDGHSRFTLFQNGSIYWNPATGAQEVHGAIRSEWGSLGYETGFLGLPTTNENTTPNGVGRYNHFQGGSVYYAPATGTHEVHGAIRDAWAAQGWEAGSLGFPVSDEHAVPGGRASSFQGGTLTYNFAAGQVSRS